MLLPSSRGFRRLTARSRRLLRLGEIHHRPHLDRTGLDRRNARGDLQGLVEIARFDEIEAAELLLGFGEWPVGGGQLLAAIAKRRGGVNGLQRLTGDVVAALL